ncbi:GID complex subunit containing RING finger motif [Lithohypha guttulata]|uniref:Protein FYV10 n=1 Tax=Lithohypha guttulata TaxID=1690604 RepID=A0AAN7T4T2_9EURO|nr:GID complex subunit containing RING finger motif [Lithohypha guttulata]
MAELSATKLNADNHLLLDQPLLRLPLELQRRNFKKSQIVIDHEQKQTTSLLQKAAKSASTASTEETLKSMDVMIARMEKLKRNLETLHTEEDTLHDQSAKRIRHLQELYEIPSLLDVKYENWSRTRLDRLLVDYLLRAGYLDTAAVLAKAKNVEDLIDLNTFVACHHIADSIQKGETKDALVWVKDNRDALKKLLEKTAPSSSSPQMISTLEFELRFQEYIGLLKQVPARPIARFEAAEHAKKHLTPHALSHAAQNRAVAGLLAQDPSNPTEPYAEYFSPSRWTVLSQLFVDTHHLLFNLPARPLLHVALSAGLSALKTPACHSSLNPASAAVPEEHAKFAPAQHRGALSSIGASLCPICSIELNELARSVPYAHHTKSSVENDAMMLPNGRVYGRDRLLELVKKNLRANAGTLKTTGSIDKVTEGPVIDPVTGNHYSWNDLKKVYIT